MKKLFTFKNCLIILFLLSIAIYFAVCNMQEFDNIQTYNAFFAENNEPLLTASYLLLKKNSIAVIITNFIIVAFILSFLLLFIISLFKENNFLKFAFITLLFSCFITYMLQVDLPWFMMDNTQGSINPNYLAKAITALIALLVSILCYVYLLVREIQKRKRTAQIERQETIAEETTQN